MVGVAWKIVRIRTKRRRSDMSEWISVRDRYPDKIGTKVWYYFEYTGVNQGEFLGEDYFGGERGVLGGDVTHWMPDTGQDKPEKPEEEIN